MKILCMYVVYVLCSVHVMIKKSPPSSMLELNQNETSHGLSNEMPCD